MKKSTKEKIWTTVGIIFIAFLAAQPGLTEFRWTHVEGIQPDTLGGSFASVSLAAQMRVETTNWGFFQTARVQHRTRLGGEYVFIQLPYTGWYRVR